MNDSTVSSITNFLIQNDFDNPSLTQISQNLQSSLYFAKVGTREITIKVFNKKELETLYQLNTQKFLRFMEFQMGCINDLTQIIPAPHLIRFNNFFVQEMDNILFYIMDYIPGETRDISAITPAQKQDIARILRLVHQTDLSHYDTSFFSIRIDLLVQSWQFFLNNQGISLVKQLAAPLQDNALNSFLDQISNEVTTQALWDVNNKSNLVIAHADIKPKNVIWNRKDEFFIIDWEDLSTMRAEIDFIDTITSWTLKKDNEEYVLNNHELKLFRDAYALPLTIKESDIHFSAAKWMSWIMTCYSRSNNEKVHDGMMMLKLLANNKRSLLDL
ncbi:aminoglycoside phosphotransferase family protein [Legionella sp. WA2024007413]